MTDPETLEEKEELQTDTCVIYDRKDGRIIHVQEIVTIEGATPPTEQELKEEAYRWAERHQRTRRDEADALMVRGADMQPGKEYVVDWKKRQLVEKK